MSDQEQQDIEIESLRRQVAMLHGLLHKITTACWKECNVPVDKAELNNALHDTQATAEAYDREHAEKVLEDVPQEIFSDLPIAGRIYVVNSLRKYAAVHCSQSAQKKEGE